MSRVRAILFGAVVLAVLYLGHPAIAADLELQPCTRGDLTQVISDCERSAEEVSGLLASSSTSGYSYQLRMQCKDNVLADVCDNPRACVTEAGEVGVWYVLQRRPSSPAAAPWEYYGDVCLRARDLERFGIITPAKVWERMKELPWPAAGLVTQPPDGRTLVNFKTNFYSSLSQDPQLQTVRMFQVPVEIEATPETYTWHWGDATDAADTDWPGAPVPDGVTEDDLEGLITHEYLDADVTVSPSVDVTYRGRYRVDGGEWVAIPQTLTLPGEAIALEVIEARVHLVG